MKQEDFGILMGMFDDGFLLSLVVPGISRSAALI